MPLTEKKNTYSYAKIVFIFCYLISLLENFIIQIC